MTDSSAPVLIVDNLRKHYLGKAALCGVSFAAEAGEVLGIMGPNGSGKTTLIKLIAGLLHATSGTITVCGKQIGVNTRSLVSFLPDRNIMPKWMTARDAMRYYKDFFSDFEEDKAHSLVAFMRIDEGMKIGAMSKGMVERLNIALCFARKAQLYLLDEPLGGVDPVAREQIVHSLHNIMRPDSAVIVSTHIAHDIEEMFTDVLFIDGGKVLLQGKAQTLKAERGMSIEDLYLSTFLSQSYGSSRTSDGGSSNTGDAHTSKMRGQE